MEFHLVESMDEVLSLAIEGGVATLPGGGDFDKATPEPPVEPGLAH